MNNFNRQFALGFLRNFIYNFLSSAFPTVVLQFIVQPILAKHLGSERFGQYLTLMSLNFFIVGITAAVLNTVRMLQNEEYEKKGIKGDFNIIILVYAVIITIALPTGWFFYTRTNNLVDIVLYLIIGYLYLYHDYIFSQYRLRMQFSKILVNNTLLVAGYIVGIVLFTRLVPKWQIVIITSYTIGAIYDYINTDFIKEPIRKTVLFTPTLKMVLTLTAANALHYAVNYFDKLLLQPLLGGTSVSIYSTASLVGKMLLLVSSPLSTLVLSYLVKIDQFKIKITKKMILALIGSMAVFYGICVVVGYPITQLLYPDWASESQKYIPITAAGGVFNFASGLLNVILIRYYKTNLQIVIQGLNLVLYLSLCMLLLSIWSLMGFSIGVTLTAFIRFVVLLVIVAIKPRRMER